MPDLQMEKELLLKRDKEWADIANEGRDVEGILSYWTEDAVVMPAGLPTVRGKEALRRYVEDSLRIPGFKINWRSDRVEFSPDGNLAYMFSQNQVEFAGPDGNPISAAGRVVTIWRREADGEWRCAVDIWNSEQ